MIKKEYYWICANVDGQTYLLAPPYNSEAEARVKGIETLGNDFTIKMYPTKDIGKASRRLKGGILDESHNMRTATKRLKHRINRNGIRR